MSDSSNNDDTRTDEQQALRVRQIVAERRALELLRIARRALRGEPFWRVEMQAVIDQIDGGVLPEPLDYPHPHQEAA